MQVLAVEAVSTHTIVSHLPLRRPLVLHTHLPGEGSARAYGKLGQGHDMTSHCNCFTSFMLFRVPRRVLSIIGPTLDTVSMSLVFSQYIILMRPQECKTLEEACCTGTRKLTCCFPAQLFAHFLFHLFCHESVLEVWTFV